MEYDRIAANAQILAEIEAFIERYNARHPRPEGYLPAMGPSLFGRLATNNPALVGRLREGSDIKQSTLYRIRAFMAAEDADLIE